ncbi:MAG TPA: hypothetical protein VFA81_03565 [Burkholderiales bacterium]|nr:hypothetical protein [Burkholderiales bacterium]
MRSDALLTLLAVATSFAASSALADTNAPLNEMLELNASAAAYAKMCDDEPVADQLKSSTMMLLATNGVAADNVQLGSAKFNDVMRRELGRYKGAKNPDCSGKVKEARERLSLTQEILRNTRRDRPE